MRHFTEHDIAHCLDLADARNLPEPDVEVPCCDASAYLGPSRCLCWLPLYSEALQADPLPDVAATARPAMCEGCAYRPGSPERTGDENARYDADDLDHLIHQGGRFFCHAGARQRIGWRHPVSGQVVLDERVGSDGRALAYAPPFAANTADGEVLPYKLDGTPLDVCAGYLARKRWIERERAQ